MWSDIISWLLNAFTKISDFGRILFMKLADLPDTTISVVGTHILIRPNFIAQIFPGFRVIDIISATGIIVIIVILIIKKVDPFA